MANLGVTRDVQAEIKKHMHLQDISQTELAERIGVNRSYLSKLLNDKEISPPPAWEKILEVLGLDLTVVAKK